MDKGCEYFDINFYPLRVQIALWMGAFGTGSAIANAIDHDPRWSWTSLLTSVVILMTMWFIVMGLAVRYPIPKAGYNLATGLLWAFALLMMIGVPILIFLLQH